MARRIIFIEVSSAGRPLASAVDDFGIVVRLEPRAIVDVRAHTGEVLQVKAIPPGSGWNTEPVTECSATLHDVGQG